LALDSSGGKIYWTHLGGGNFPPQRANLDGTSREPIGDSNLSNYGIAVDAPRGKVYWTQTVETNPGDYATFIRRANLDGSNVENVVRSPADTSFQSLAIDTKAQKVYWGSGGAGKIGWVNMDGTGIEILLNDAGSGQFGHRRISFRWNLPRP
jgi:hypothetical protein